MSYDRPGQAPSTGRPGPYPPPGTDPGLGADPGVTQPYPVQSPYPYPAQQSGGDHGRSYPHPAAPYPAAQQYPPTQAFGPGQGPAPDGPRRPAWRSAKILVPLIAIAVLGLLAGVGLVYVKLRGVQSEAAPTGTPTPTGQAAQMPAGRTWLSGAWAGGKISDTRINGFGAWRGQPADVATTYPAYETWDEMRDSEWAIKEFDDFPGRLSYGLPLQPKNKDGGLGDVADGKYDDVFATIADQLVKHKRGDTFVRIGLEANGTWFPWGADAARADRYKAAWRHVQQVMKSRAPDLVFGFDITCGKALEGGSDRMDNLNRLYPGDDVVDVVGCDHYDSYTVKTRNESEWENTLRPEKAAGLADVADFARQHGKKLVVPEWGLTGAGPDKDGKNRDGAGDNPFFIYKMYSYFQQNKDILAYENYFNEPDDYLGSSIWEPVLNPKAAEEYRKLWGAPPAKTGATGSASPS